MHVNVKPTQLVALVLVLGTYYCAREPQTSTAEKQRLASRFAFDRHEIPTSPFESEGLKSTRKVHPSLERIKSWISATGAAATLADLDHDGLENDLLLVDPRIDRIMVMPCPGTGTRYPSFTLEAGPLPFDSDSMSPTGSIVGDFNEDGLTDILVYYWGRTPILFMRREPDLSSGASFAPEELLAVAAGELPDRWYSHAATQADIDGDGHLDLIVGNFFQDGADILNEQGTGVATVMHAGKSKAKNGGGAKLFIWRSTSPDSAPTPRFRNASDVLEKICGKGWVLAAGAADLDQDGLPEIYLAHDFGPDRLLHNRSKPGQPEFALCEGVRDLMTPKSFVLGKDSFKGMGLGFGDVNHDGILDIYVSNIADEWALQESHFLWISTGQTQDFQNGVAPYKQSSEKYGLSRSGWGWDSRLIDFDNDGDLEAIQATGFAKGELPKDTSKLSTVDQWLAKLGYLEHGINRWAELQALGTTNDQMIHDPRFWPKFQPPTADLSGYNTNPFFVRSGSGRFVNVAAELGINDPFNTRGIAVADVNGDGRLDFVYANQWAPSVLFENQSSPRHGFLGLHLFLPLESDEARPFSIQPGATQGLRNCRRAIGAVARLKLPDGHIRVAQADGGSGHSGHGSQAIHFGLGSTPAESLEVELQWRTIDGILRAETIHVTPGWNTVVLGAPVKGESI